MDTEREYHALVRIRSFRFIDHCFTTGPFKEIILAWIDLM